MLRVLLILVLSVLLLIPVVIIIIPKIVRKFNAWIDDITNWGCAVTDIKVKKEEQSSDADVVKETISF